jgi:curved DNA-binding protein CbpA
MELKKSYKKLLRKYHPDKFSNNPNKLKIATEITKKINESFSRIREYEKKKSGNI